jgi:hypothetical protein
VKLWRTLAGFASYVPYAEKLRKNGLRGKNTPCNSHL